MAAADADDRLHGDCATTTRSGRRGASRRSPTSMIRAAVHTGQFSDPAAEKYLADVLIQRREKIKSIYLTQVNPIVNPRLDAKRPDVRERRRHRRRGPRHGGVPRVVDVVRQRHRRDQADRRRPRARRRRSRRRAACRRAASWPWTSPPTATPTRRGSSPCAPTSARMAAAGSWSASSGCPTRRRPDEGVPQSQSSGHREGWSQARESRIRS